MPPRGSATVRLRLTPVAPAALGASYGTGAFGGHFDEVLKARAARDIDPSYTPDLASEIDGDNEEPDKDFYFAAELLREILTFCYAYRGDKPQPDLKVAFMRFTCITWLTRPELVGNLPLAELLSTA